MGQGPPVLSRPSPPAVVTALVPTYCKVPTEGCNQTRGKIGPCRAGTNEAWYLKTDKQPHW